MSDNDNPTPLDTKPVDVDHPEQTFTQADVDRIVADRLKRERDAVKAKYADYDDMKAKAAGAQTAETRIAALEQQVEESKREALRARYADGVPERLRPLLTGTTEDELKAQRELLVEGESERKKQGARVPNEGKTTPKPGDDEMVTFTRGLFASRD